MLAAIFGAFAADMRRNVHAFKRTAALTLIAVVAALVAAGFGLSLITVWLEQLYGTMTALAIVGGGCAALALILFTVALWHPKPRPQPAPRVAEATDIDVARRTIADSERAIDDALTTMQQGTRESMLAAVSLAVVTGIILGRKL
jgi:type VI protein secretion system component VasK